MSDRYRELHDLSLAFLDAFNRYDLDAVMFYFTDDAVYEGMHRVGEAEVKALETLMDQCQKDLQPLKSFTLPGGGRVGGFLHQARTVCRRAERRVLALSRVEPISPWTIAYVNRLSDLLFVLSRWVARKGGETEYLWERGLASHARKRT